jgi:hypothetical protein
MKTNKNHYQISRITGPSHNFLSVTFSDCKNDKILVEDLSNTLNKNIEPARVRRQVLSTLQEMNNELQTNFHINKIEFVSADTPAKTIYKTMTKEIIIKHHKENDIE